MTKEEVKGKLAEAIDIVSQQFKRYTTPDDNLIIVAVFNALCDEYPSFLRSEGEQGIPARDLDKWLDEPDGTPLEGLLDSDKPEDK